MVLRWTSPLLIKIAPGLSSARTPNARLQSRYLAKIGKSSIRFLSTSHSNEGKPPNEASVSKDNTFFGGALGRLFPFLWPKDGKHKRMVVGALSSLAIAKVATIEAPLLLGHLVDSLAEQAASVKGVGETSSLVSGVATDPTIALELNHLLTALVSGYALARITSSCFNELRNAIFSRVSHHACNVVACQTFSHLHKLDLDFILLSKSGELTTILSRGIRSITQLLNMMLFQVIPTVFEFLLVLSLLTWKLGAPITLIVSLTMTAYVAFTMKVTSKRTEYRKEMNRAEQKAAGIMTDSLTNAEAVRLFTNELFELQRYGVYQKQFEMANIKVAESLAFLNVGQQTIFNVGLFAALILTTLQVSSGAIPVGHIAFVSSLLFQLAIPLNMIGSVYRETKLNLIDLEKLHLLLSLRPKCISMPNALPFQFKQGLIQFENIHFEYRSQSELLEDISLDATHSKLPNLLLHEKLAAPVPIFSGLNMEMQPGWKVGVIGPSGCGKSSLIKLMYRLYDPQSGTIKFDGQNVRYLDLNSFRKHIGVVPQDIVLFNDSLMYNLRYGNPSATDEEVIQATKGAEIYDSIQHNFPDGLNTLVGERGMKLSGGERQRVGIARCLLQNPKIVVLDEATSALDLGTERRVLKALKAVTAGRTSLVIAHRLSTIVDSDRIYVIDKGKVQEFGTHADLLGIPNSHYARLWASQKVHFKGQA